MHGEFQEDRRALSDSFIEVMNGVAGITDTLGHEIKAALGSMVIDNITNEEASQLERLRLIAEQMAAVINPIIRDIIDLSSQSNPSALDEATKSQVGEGINLKQGQPTRPKDIPEQALVVLDNIGLDVLEYARTHDDFKIEDLRRDIKSIKELSEDEYKLFKYRFKYNLRADIARHLNTQGVEAHWQIEGRTRGQKYSLVFNEESASHSLKTGLASNEEPGLDQPAKVTTIEEVLNHISENLDLSERESVLLSRVFQLIKPGVWFQQKQLNLESIIHFSSVGAKNQAFKKFTDKLIKAGLLISEGNHGGKKYKIVKRSDFPNEPVISSRTGQPEGSHSGVQINRTIIYGHRSLPENRVQQFTDNLYSYIAGRLNNAGGKDRLSLISRDISEILGINQLEASNAISNLVAQGWLYKVGENGYKQLSLTQPDVISKPLISREEKTTKTQKNEIWDEHYTQGLIVILEALANLRNDHLSKGLELMKVYTDNPELKDNGITFDKIKRIARLASNAGVIEIFGANRKISRSRGQLKMTVTVNKDQKLRINDNILDVIETVRVNFESK